MIRRIEDKRARKGLEWLRAFGSQERVRFVAALPCRVSCCDERPCHNAHAKTGGMGRKADYRFILPLCAKHHRQAHDLGVRTFENRYKIGLLECADWTEFKWQEHLGRISRVDRVASRLLGYGDPHDDLPF